MVKKVTKKRVTKKKTVNSGTSSNAKLINSLIKRDELLVDNFVGLQKALVNVSVKFNDLSDRIDKLLSIYQRAADVFIQKQINESDKRVELDRKVSNVIQQNKTLARRHVMARQGSVPQNMPRPTQPTPQKGSSQFAPSIFSGDSVPTPGKIPPVPEPSNQMKPRALPKL
jgi:hypothetical protein